MATPDSVPGGGASENTKDALVKAFNVTLAPQNEFEYALKRLNDDTETMKLLRAMMEKGEPVVITFNSQKD